MLPTLLVVTVGSVVLGLVLARVTLAVNARIRDVATAVVVQFCGTFGVWILAEQLHLSGIITMVVFAMAAARRAPELTPARIRIPSYAVWVVAVFVLNVLAFILVGFQLKSIAARASVLVHTEERPEGRNGVGVGRLGVGLEEAEGVAERVDGRVVG